VGLFWNDRKIWDGRVPSASLIYPIAVFSNMITRGIGISNTRIAMLHLNGAITDLNFRDISDAKKLEIFDRVAFGEKRSTQPPGPFPCLVPDPSSSMSEMVDSMKEGVDKVMKYFYGDNFYRNGSNTENDQLRYIGIPSPIQNDSERFYKCYIRVYYRYRKIIEQLSGSFREQFIEYIN
jgi:hypothetical protein